MLIAEVIENVTELGVAVYDTPEVITAVVNDGGARGPAGPAAATTFVRSAGQTLSALVVVWEDETGIVYPADYRDDANIDFIVGVTITSTAIGNEITIQRSGSLDAVGLNLTAGRVWLGATGSLTQVPPLDGYDVLIGYATSDQRLYIDIKDNIKLEE
jgi:hypothetical protein